MADSWPTPATQAVRVEEEAKPVGALLLKCA